MIRSLKISMLAIIAVVLVLSCNQTPQQPTFGLVIHGGAGTILKENMTPEREAAYKAKLTESLQTGHDILKNGGTALDAVEAAIIIMEDSPLFNSAKGAVFTSDGRNELDAAIMDGSDLNAGAVASLHTVKNPIKAARAVMEHSPHVLLAGEGADKFAAEQGLEIVDPKYFFTQRRWDSLQRIKEREKGDGSTGADARGTVGAAALDLHGNLAAGTSTGGMTNKRYGRIGDVPIIGAGTYANNATVALSATGHGEYFIRSVVGHDISALMDYKGMSVKEAANEVIMNKLVARGGDGGVVAIDRWGNISLTFNTAGMYRGHIDAEGNITLGIYKENE